LEKKLEEINFEKKSIQKQYSEVLKKKDELEYLLSMRLLAPRNNLL
jgi:hypothetical protein